MKEHVNDVHVQRARREGYRSRAAYKLTEIAERDKLLRRGMVVVDLGAAPGSWSQVVQKSAGRDGLVVAFDILEMEPLAGVTVLQGDFREQEAIQMLEQALGGRKVDLVLSDMSPNISGIAISDQARAMDLAELAFEFARAYLKPGGCFLVKVFQGAGFQEFFRAMQRTFKTVSTRKPEASRGRSSELYLLGKNFVANIAPNKPAN